MLAIVDYGVGNLFSLKSSCTSLQLDTIVTGDASLLAQADHIILPGVGAFRDAANRLRESGLDTVLRREAQKGKPLLGICLGMQLLFDTSYEFGTYSGLGLIPGEVVPIRDVIEDGLKIPHIGWNALHMTQAGNASPLLKSTREGDHVYFVHSFYATGCEPYILATAEYGAALTAAVQRDNIYGTQFHPEKSGSVGLAMLRAFSEIPFSC